MASYVKYDVFTEDLAQGVHDLFGTAGSGANTLKVLLSNTAPNVSTDALRSQTTELSTANGYTSGGQSVANVGTRSGGVTTVVATDVVWTASGGSIGPFRYVILYNDTPTSPLDPLVAYWDYGSSITLLTTETFTVDFGATLLTIT